MSLSTRSLHRCKRFNEGVSQAHNLQHQNKTLTFEGYKRFRHELNESANCKMVFENQETYLCRTDGDTIDKKTGLYESRQTLVRVCVCVCIAKTHSLNNNSSIRSSISFCLDTSSVQRTEINRVVTARGRSASYVVIS